MERRQLLTWLVHGGTATLAMVVGVPTLIYAVSPGKRRQQAAVWRDLGWLENFPVGEITAAVVQRAPEATRAPDDATQLEPVSLATGADAANVRPGVYVWRTDEENVIVFSRSCTDLGCPVTFDRGSECFLCPCHGGIFDKQGERMAGPPDRPLYRYDTRVTDGVLQVDLSSVPPMV